MNQSGESCDYIPCIRYIFFHVLSPFTVAAMRPLISV